MAFEPAGKVQFQQDHEDLSRMQPGVTDELVNVRRRWAERLDQTCAIVVARRGRLVLESLLWLGVLFALLLASIILIMNTYGKRLVIAETKRRIEEAVCYS